MIPVEQVFYPYDNSIIWYPISGFPGYEATIHNELLYVRSLKQFKKFPVGDLIYPKNDKYQLTNFNNQRANVSIQEIVDNMNKDDPRSTMQVESYKARNKRMGIMCVDSPNVGTVVKNPKPVRKLKDNTYFMPKFTVIKGGEDGE